MARLTEVDDAGDARLDAYVRLRDVQLRTRLELERGLYIAEGEKVVRRALEAGHRPHSFLLAPRWIDSLADVLAGHDVPCFVLDEATIEQVTGFHVHRGALAAMHRPDPLDAADLLARSRRVVVLEDLSDHANVGSAVRAAAGLGFDAVLLSPRCADPFYRRAVKVSMGAVFTLPHARVDDWWSTPDLLRSAGFTTYALALADDAVDLADVPVDTERVAVVFGAEGHGLSDRWQRACDAVVTIPMAAEIDSLNVASSVAVTCWHLRPR